MISIVQAYVEWFLSAIAEFLWTEPIQYFTVLFVVLIVVGLFARLVKL